MPQSTGGGTPGILVRRARFKEAEQTREKVARWGKTVAKGEKGKKGGSKSHSPQG